MYPFILLKIGFLVCVYKTGVMFCAFLYVALLPAQYPRGVAKRWQSNTAVHLVAAQHSRRRKPRFVPPCPSEQCSVSSFPSWKTSVRAVLNTLVHMFCVPLAFLFTEAACFNLGRKLNVVYFQIGLWHTSEPHWAW